MLLRRRKMPPELRAALKAAERGDAPQRRRSLWRRMEMLLPGALVPSLLIIIAYAVWHREVASPAHGPLPVVIAPGPSEAAPRVGSGGAPSQQPTRAAMPRVIYGTATAPPADPSGGGTFSARVRVIDGDTLATGDDRLRLNGIDAPEMGQPCEGGGVVYDCGEAARAAMARIIGGGALRCEAIGHDQYRRRVVRCTDAAGEDIGASLVAQGWAMAYRRFSMDYVPQEDAARSRGLGIWAGRFEAPWDWRRRQTQ